MPNVDEMIEAVSKSGVVFPLLKRFCETGNGELSEHAVTQLLLGAWGSKDFAKNLQSDTADGRIARAALQRAKHAAWGIGA
jgi:hypothetical protein